MKLKLLLVLSCFGFITACQTCNDFTDDFHVDHPVFRRFVCPSQIREPNPLFTCNRLGTYKRSPIQEVCTDKLYNDGAASYDTYRVHRCSACAYFPR